MFNQCPGRVCGENCVWTGYCTDGAEKQNTAVLPDYPSIRELSTELSEDAKDIKAAEDAKGRDDFVSLEELKAEIGLK
jgi:hypothetical protein